MELTDEQKREIRKSLNYERLPDLGNDMYTVRFRINQRKAGFNIELSQEILADYHFDLLGYLALWAEGVAISLLEGENVPSRS